MPWRCQEASCVVYTGLFSCGQLSKGHSIPWDSAGQVEDLAGVCVLSLTIPIGVSSSLAAPVSESQKGQGPGPVSGAQQVAAGTVRHPSFALFAAPAQVAQADTVVWAASWALAPFLLPSAFAIAIGTPEESGHGQCSTVLHLGRAGVGSAVLRAQSSLSEASTLLQQHSPGPALR